MRGQCEFGKRSGWVLRRRASWCQSSMFEWIFCFGAKALKLKAIDVGISTNFGNGGGQAEKVFGVYDNDRELNEVL